MKSANELWAAIMAVKQSQGMCGFRDAFEATLPAIRDEVRQACVKAYVDARRNGGGDMECQVAINNAGKEPELKPGMLATSRAGRGYAFEWSQLHTEFAANRPMTRAEIMAYADKAPEEVV